MNKYILFLSIILSIYEFGFSQQRDIEIIPGTEIQSGIGNFANPITLRGTTISMNGALGASSKTNTFGYNVFDVNVRTAAGTSNFGRRLIFQFGAANWFTPALSAVYADSALTQEEIISESSSINSLMVGVGFTLLKKRSPSDRDWQNHRQELQKYDLDIINATTELEQNRIRAERASYKWEQIFRPSYRKPSAMVGSVFRLGALGFESNVEVVDFYGSFAAGKKLFDFVTSVHYLLPIQDALVGENAKTSTVGFFYDLDDTPAFSLEKSPQVRTLGLTFALGKYNYIEKSQFYPISSSQENSLSEFEFSNEPSTTRLDVNFTVNGLFGNVGAFGSGIGIKYSQLWHDSAPNESQFQIQFSSKFLANFSR